jgi:manganese transport protein
MQGFLQRNSSVWLRRAVSSVPALIVLALVSDPTQALIASQVVLSFGLPFALIPLMMFTARRSLMGQFTNRTLTTMAGLLITAIVLSLNGFLLARLFLTG